MGRILLTGAAGFIGAKTAQFLLDSGKSVLGIDNLNAYYDSRLKKYRLSRLKGYERFSFRQVDIENLPRLRKIFKKNKINAIVNLAARAGVRYSLENPFVYHTTNATGTLNLLEMARAHRVKKFILASTSSLYAGQKMPFKETLSVNPPLSPYAATKKAAEVMCYTYHYLYGIDVTVLRYFTVYGPAGRPDMSVFRFIKWIDEGNRVELFGDGSQTRDFTYIDDIALGTVRALHKKVGFKIINLGGNKPHSINKMIHLIEKYLQKKAKVTHRKFHKADMKATWADTREARRVLNWKPRVSLEEGIRRSVEWYLQNKQWLKCIRL